MKTYNIIGKNNDMVIFISGCNEEEAVKEARETLQNCSFRIKEIEEE